MPRIALLLALILPAFGAGCAAQDSPPPTFVEDVPGSGESETGGDRTGKAWDPVEMALGERVYVPIYSHIYFRDSRRDIDLAATLSVRNTDGTTPIRLTAVRYYDNAGALVRRYIDTPVSVGPMASTNFLVEQQDDSGGVGANFIVEWQADLAVTPPVVEAVMISASNSQGISFVTQGRVLHRARSASESSAEPNE
ncbi:MAG: DUF3124 domain-containing protein [Rhodothermales bacterium]